MQRLTIPAHDRDGVRVFTARLTPEDLRRDKAALAATLLGDPHLDPAYLEIFDLSDLTGVGLSRYLSEGLGVPATALRDPDPARRPGGAGCRAAVKGAARPRGDA